MTEEQRINLEKPFRPEEIKQRDGGGGRTLSYIEGNSVIARLNLAFNSEWSCQVIQHIVDRDADEIIVQARITAGSVIKDGFGSSKIKRNLDTGEIVDLGNDMKAATTDAIKKAATLLGVGLYLYGSTKPSTGNTPRQAQNHGGQATSHHSQQRNQTQSHNTAEPTDHHDSSTGGGSNRLSQKQHSYILKLASGVGMSKAEISKHCQQVYGVMLDFISRHDASAFIDDLRHNRIQSNQAA